MSSSAVKRVALIGSPEKSAAAAAIERARNWLAARAEVVFAALTFDSRAALQHRPDLMIVFGGDGTLISVAHGLGRDQIPILGVNLGKLGFLAEFTLAQLETYGDFLFENGLPVSRRLILDVTVHNGEKQCQTPAVNDCVVLSGPPFRIIQIIAEVDGDEVARFRGDGLIVATPTGSTAHNLSAGGPIVEPSAASTILTPICPHALTFRPLVLSADHVIELSLGRANEGTNVMVDGRFVRPLKATDRVRIRRFPSDLELVRNPRDSQWSALRRKLMWGAGPVEE